MSSLLILKMILTALIVTLLIETLLSVVFFKTRTARSIVFVMIPQYITVTVSALFIGVLSPALDIPFPQYIAIGGSLVMSIFIEGLLFKINELHDHPYLMAIVLNIASFAACSALSFFGILPNIF